MHLVIGAAGYAGRHAVAALAGAVEVRAAAPGDDLAAAMAGADVVHLAAELYGPNDRLGWGPRPHPFLVEVVGAAREAGVRRLVHLSSAHVHGAGPVEPVTERARLRPLHPYERLLARDETWLREQGCPEVVVLRPAQGFGPGEPLVTCLVRRLLSGRVLLPGGGRASRTFLAGADLGAAFLAAGLRGQAGMAYLVGGFQSCWHDLLVAAGRALGVEARILHLNYEYAYLATTARRRAGAECWRTAFVVDLLARPQRVVDGWSRRELTWSPRARSFEEGIGDAAAWKEFLDGGPGSPALI